MGWWIRWSTASKGSKSLVPDLLRQAPYLVFRAGRAGDEARAVGCGFGRRRRVVERRASEERLDLSGRSCRQSVEASVMAIQGNRSAR